MKKICMIATVSTTLKSFMVEIAKYLYHSCGYDITLICNHDDKFAKELPEYLHFIPVKMERGISLSGFGAINEFRRIFRREKFDLVQYATPNAACYASIAAKLEKVPVRLYCQWGIRYVGLHGIVRWIFKKIEKMICKLSTDIHSASRRNMQFAIQEKLYPSKKAKVVGNGGTIGVDLKTYDIANKADWRRAIRNKYGIDESDFVFGFAGRITVDKGCNELLSAFRTISNERPYAKLLVVGPIETNCGVDPELLSWSQNSAQVIFTGRVVGDEMPMYYSALDVLVHPTYREGFGMVIQEAGALAVPTITTRIPGASEVMEEDVSCELVEARNTEQLAEMMSKMYMSPDSTTAIGENAYVRTLKLYERMIMLENQCRAYKELIED